MQLMGLPPSVLLRALAIGAAFVVLMYMLRLRRRAVAVVFAPMWLRVVREKDVTSWLARLKRWLSLLLQLILFSGLVLALGDPQPTVGNQKGRHIVVLVDASGSMKAQDASKEVAPADGATGAANRLDAARAHVLAWAEGLGPFDQMLIVQVDGAVTPLSTMTSERSELKAAAGKLRARDVTARFDLAFPFALDALRGRSRPEIIVVSDGGIGEARVRGGEMKGVRLSYQRVGVVKSNLGITAFSVRRYPLDKRRAEVLVEVSNGGEKSESVDVELYEDGRLIQILPLQVPARDRLKKIFSDVAGTGRVMEARLRHGSKAADGLETDDRAYALLPERRRVRVQVVTAGNMYLQAALLLDEYLEVTTVEPDAFPAPGRFDVTIVDEVAPATSDKSGHVLYLNPPREGKMPFTVGKRIVSDKRYTIGFDEVRTKHPIVRHLLLEDVNIRRARVLKPDKGGRVVGASMRGALLLAGRSDGRKYVALGFDVRESDLPLRVAWPLLVMNVIERFVDDDLGYLSSLKTGEVWSIPVDDDLDRVSVEWPNGRRAWVAVDEGRAVLLGQQAGVYGWKPKEGGQTQRFAANMASPTETAIAPLDELKVAGVNAGTVQGLETKERRPWWLLLVGAVMAISCLEWWSYHRRITV